MREGGQRETEIQRQVIVFNAQSTMMAISGPSERQKEKEKRRRRQPDTSMNRDAKGDCTHPSNHRKAFQSSNTCPSSAHINRWHTSPSDLGEINNKPGVFQITEENLPHEVN